MTDILKVEQEAPSVLGASDDRLVAGVERLLQADPNVGGCRMETQRAIVAFVRNETLDQAARVATEVVNERNAHPEWNLACDEIEARILSLKSPEHGGERK